MAPKAPEALKAAGRTAKEALRTGANRVRTAIEDRRSASNAPEARSSKPEILGAPDYIQPTAFEDEFVGYYDKATDPANPKDSTEIDKALANDIKAYMARHGIQSDPSAPDFDQDEYDTIIGVLGTVSQVSSDAWHTQDPLTHRSKRDSFVTMLQEEYDNQTWRRWEQEQLAEGLEPLKKEAAELADRYGKLLAKRADKAGLFERTAKLESIKQQHADYLSGIASQMADENASKDDTDPTKLTSDQLATEIDQFIDQQSQLFVERMEQSRIEASAGRNRVMKFVTEKWASWTPEAPAMQTGHKLLSMQTLKNAGLYLKHSYSKEHRRGTLMKNAVTALGGMALTAVVPAAAAVGAIGAAAGFVGARSARAYAVQKMNALATAEKIATAQRADIETRITALRAEYDTTTTTFLDRLRDFDARIDAAETAGDADTVATLKTERQEFVTSSDTRSLHEMIADLTNERAKAAHDYNRDRLLGGMAMAMAFGAAGTKLHALLPDNINQSIGGFINRLTGGGNSSTGASVGASVDSSIHPNEGAAPRGGLRGPLYDTPVPPETAPVAKMFDAGDYLNRHDVNLTLKKGEGFMALAKHFPGVSQAEMKAEMVSLAKELDAKYPKLVYFHGGEPRLSMPPNGKLPAGAAEMIVEHFHAKGMLDADKTGEVKGSDALGIRRGGGIIGEAKDYGIADLTRDEITTLGDALVEEGTGYKSDRLANKFGSPYGIKLDVAGDTTPSGQFRPGADAIFRDFADNRMLDHSNTLPEAVKQGNIDTIVRSFASEHGLDNVPSLDSMIADPKTADAIIPGISKVVASGDVDHSGSLINEMKDYLVKSAANKVDFNNALHDASTSHNFGGISKFQSVIDAAGKELVNLQFSEADGGGPIATFDQRTGHYILQNTGKNLPESARQLLQKTAIRTDYGLAA
ncbi:MAG: hypothetical protein WBB39_01180 [Candidatus Saccharimonadales bacterium]